MAQFFQTNIVIVYFVYGEAFFVLGLAIALQSRKHSQLALARHLWLLAVFGIVHGIYEWGAVFIPIQQTYVPASVVSFLRIVQLVLGAMSFLALYQFGVELVLIGTRKWRWLSGLPVGAFLGWALVIFLAESYGRATLDQVVVLGEVLARYGLATPGALAAAWGLWRQAQQVSGMDLPRISNYFRGAAYAFLAYAGLSAIVPRADFFPASLLNYDFVLNTIGVPVPVFRALAGTAIAYLIIRGSEIFDVETDRMLEEVAQARAVAADRERIGRELHDGIIQSLYASGLMLEDASLSIDEDTAQAKERIRGVIDSLNRTIRDIRRFILDLRGETDATEWQNGLGELVHSFHLETLVDAELHVEGPERRALTREQGKELLNIAREALTNVGKHARATRVDVTLTFRPDAIELAIEDNGIGFSRNGSSPHTAGEHQGIRNMQERARLLGGELAVNSAPGQGTVVRLVVPIP
jgi:signal transduction histidine kinase